MKILIRNNLSRKWRFAEAVKVQAESSCRNSEKFSNPVRRALRRVWDDIKRHKKGYIATAAIEAWWLKYLHELRNVAWDPLVEMGLGIGKVITYPVKPELFGWPPWPHIVDTERQIPMDPIYEDNPIVHAILNIGRNLPIVNALALAPIIAYGVYRVWDYKRGKKK